MLLKDKITSIDESIESLQTAIKQLGKDIVSMKESIIRDKTDQWKIISDTIDTLENNGLLNQRGT